MLFVAAVVMLALLAGAAMAQTAASGPVDPPPEFAQLRQQYAAKPDVWADVLRTTLNLAAGWLTFGLVDQAAPVLEAARQEILSGVSKVPVLKFTKLA